MKMAWVVNEQKRLLEERKDSGKYIDVPKEGSIKVMIKVSTPPEKVERTSKKKNVQYSAYEFETAEPGKVLSVFENVYREIVGALAKHADKVDTSDFVAIEITQKSGVCFVQVVAGV